MFVFQQRTVNGLPLPPVTGGGSKVRHRHGTNPSLSQQLRQWIVFFFVLLLLLRWWIICIRRCFLATDLWWCSCGGGSLRLSPANPFFSSLSFVAISGSLQLCHWTYLWWRSSGGEFLRPSSIYLFIRLSPFVVISGSLW